MLLNRLLLALRFILRLTAFSPLLRKWGRMNLRCSSHIIDHSRFFFVFLTLVLVLILVLILIIVLLILIVFFCVRIFLIVQIVFVKGNSWLVKCVLSSWELRLILSQLILILWNLLFRKICSVKNTITNISKSSLRFVRLLFSLFLHHFVIPFSLFNGIFNFWLWLYLLVRKIATFTWCFT